MAAPAAATAEAEAEAEPLTTSPADGAAAAAAAVAKLPLADRGRGPFRNVHRNVAVAGTADGPKGRRLVAAAPIAAGTVVWEDAAEEPFGAAEYDEAAVLALPEAEAEERSFLQHFGYQVSAGKVCAPASRAAVEDDVSHLWNHSCDPNTWVVDDTHMVARRDIAAGEELAADYGTWLTSAFLASSFERCLCGAAACRGRVTADDWKNPELRARYGKHYSEFILDMQAELDAAAAAADKKE